MSYILFFVNMLIVCTCVLPSMCMAQDSTSYDFSQNDFKGFKFSPDDLIQTIENDNIGIVAKSELLQFNTIKDSILDPENKDSIWEEASPTEVRLKSYFDISTGQIRKIVGEDTNKIWAIIDRAHQSGQLKVPQAETPILRLNKLLEKKDLYKYLRQRTLETDDLIKKLESGESIDIKHLNRRLIENNYRRYTPQKSIAQSSQGLAAVISRRIQNIRESKTENMGEELNELDQNGIKDMSVHDVFNLIDVVDFGDPATEQSQGPFFILESIAEQVRDRTTSEDVAFVYAKFEHAQAIKDAAKWFKVLESIAHQKNQEAYLKILNQLSGPVLVGDFDLAGKALNEKEKYFAKIKTELAQMIGRVMGGYVTAETLKVLFTFADNKEEIKQLAFESVIGYVGHVDAATFAVITNVINEKGLRSRNQVIAAIHMLGQIATEDSLKILKKLTSDPNTEIAKTAQDMLKQLLQNNPSLVPSNK